MSLTYQNTDAARSLGQQQILDWQRGWQVVDPASGSNVVTTGTNSYEVDVAAGDVNLGGNTVSATAQTLDLSADMPTNNPAMAVVYRDSNGDAQYVVGATSAQEPTGASTRESYQPAPPTLYNTDGTVLAEVLLRAGASEITASDIRDRRLGADLDVVALGLSNGTSTDLAVTFENGAGFYVDSNGEIVAVDEAGNETVIS